VFRRSLFEGYDKVFHRRSDGAELVTIWTRRLVKEMCEMLRDRLAVALKSRTQTLV
jgi:hypothetical protein